MSFADLQREIAAETMAALSNATVQPASGAPFAARLQSADGEAYGAVVGTHTLRYLASAATLSMRQALTINGVQFRVVEPPKQLNHHECIAQISEA